MAEKIEFELLFADFCSNITIVKNAYHNVVEATAKSSFYCQIFAHRKQTYYNCRLVD